MKVLIKEIKIFIFNDQGHASIRMTQQNYFEGKYLGCDHKSGLRLPDWIQLFKAWNINVTKINKGFENDQKSIDIGNELLLENQIYNEIRKFS